jgi:hypothetical protein
MQELAGGQDVAVKETWVEGGVDGYSSGDPAVRRSHFSPSWTTRRQDTLYLDVLLSLARNAYHQCIQCIEIAHQYKEYRHIIHPPLPKFTTCWNRTAMCRASAYP